MKDINKQIEFIDTKLLPLFGLENIKDYVNHIKCSLDDDNDKNVEKEFIKKINDLLSDIKTLFPIKRFNLHKTDNKIMTYKQVINILKMCLEIANINYTIDKLKNTTIMRLNTINLFLYKYIQTMKISDETSDLRQNNNILNNIPIIPITSITPITPITPITQYLPPGTKEAHKIYTNYTTNDLRKQIKTAKTSHILLTLKHFISNNNGKKIFEIPLNLIKSQNISGIKFAENEFYNIKQQKIVDKYYILSNKFQYMIDGKFEFCKNLIPNDIIIPLNISSYCDLKLYIPLNIDNEEIFNVIISELCFEIEFVEPIFYKSFQEKLLTEKDCFLLQEFDNKVLLYDFNQKDFIVQKDNNKYVTKEEEENDSIIFIDNIEYNINKIKIGNLNGYEFPYTPNICKPNFIYALVSKNCDFIKSKITYISGSSNTDKYTKTNLFTEKLSDNNFKHILNISFNRHCDTIGNITIIQKFNNFEKIKVECKFTCPDIDCIPITLKEKLYDANDFITKNSKVMYFSELENKQINLLNNYGFTLRFTLESNNSVNLFNYIYFIYDIYYYDLPIRKNIFKLENFFDQNLLNKCVKN